MSSLLKKLSAGAVAAAMAASLSVMGGGAAFATNPCDLNVTSASSSSVNTFLNTYLTTYGVRAGSAGGDYLGITNTNFDYTGGSASSDDLNLAPLQGTDYSCTTAQTSRCALTIWGNQTVNENANLLYTNLLYNDVNNTLASGATVTTASPYATTWMSNDTDHGSSWGDSNNSDNPYYNVKAGMEFGGPDIVFGANRTGNNWTTPKNSATQTYFYSYDSTSNTWDPAYALNDATNIWTQVYTESRLAAIADGISGKSVRYNSNSAAASAEDYERVIRGNELYVASQIYYGNATKRTVAYLYAIDEDGTGYFFTPQASSMLVGNDTGASSTSTQSTPNANYAANNGTINLGYMGTLPFITNTFNNGTEVSGGIVMKVEDIWKSNPAITVTASNALANVDYIIYNTSVASSIQGTSGGKNSSGIETGYSGGLTDSTVLAWAQNHGFTKGSAGIVAGDDWGTSSNQPVQADANKYAYGTAPRLYCQRNYTMDKNARAAWAFARIYPELYGNNRYATYEYWVDRIYHVNTDDASTQTVETDYVADIVECMCKTPETLTYDSSVASTIDGYCNIGYVWWLQVGVNDPTWNGYKYYTGSSRGSYYDGLTTSQEPSNTIGIFAPSSNWTLTSAELAAAQSTINTYSSTTSNADNNSLLRGLIFPEKAYAENSADPLFDGEDEEHNFRWALYDVTEDYEVWGVYGARALELVIAPLDSTKDAVIPDYEGYDRPWFGEGTDYRGNSVASVKIEEGITSIGENAFIGRDTRGNPTVSIQIPKSVKSIGKSSFKGLGTFVGEFSWTTFTSPVSGRNVSVSFAGVNEDGVDGSNLNSIGSLAFYNDGSTFTEDGAAVSFNDIFVPEGTSIAEDAFYMADGSSAANASFIKYVASTKDIADAAVADIADQEFTNAAIEPELTMTYGENVLVKDEDYTVEFTDNTAVGIATATITGAGKYEGTKKVTFNIVAAEEDTQAVDGAIALINAIGTVSVDSKEAVEAARAAYDKLTDVQKALVSAEALKVLTDAEAAYGDAVDAKQKEDAAEEADLANATVTLSQASMTYTGKALEPAVTVKSKGGVVLKQETDYTVAYASNTNAGTAVVTVTGKGSYTGNAKATFTIAKAAQQVTIKAKSKTFKKKVLSKKAKSFSIGAKASGKGALAYKVTKSNKKIKFKNGKVTVKKGTKKGTYKIKVKVTAKATKNYKAASKAFTVTVKVK